MQIKTNIRAGSGGKPAVSNDVAGAPSNKPPAGGGGGGGGGGSGGGVVVYYPPISRCVGL